MSTAIDKVRMLRRRQEETLEFHVDPLPKLGGKFAAIDKQAVDQFNREMGLWMERFMDQIRRVRSEDQAVTTQATAQTASTGQTIPVIGAGGGVVTPPTSPAPPLWTADSELITADTEEHTADEG